MFRLFLLMKYYGGQIKTFEFLASVLITHWKSIQLWFRHRYLSNNKFVFIFWTRFSRRCHFKKILPLIFIAPFGYKLKKKKTKNCFLNSTFFTPFRHYCTILSNNMVLIKKKIVIINEDFVLIKRELLSVSN